MRQYCPVRTQEANNQQTRRDAAKFAGTGNKSEVRSPQHPIVLTNRIYSTYSYLCNRFTAEERAELLLARESRCSVKVIVVRQLLEEVLPSPASEWAGRFARRASHPNNPQTVLDTLQILHMYTFKLCPKINGGILIPVSKYPVSL